MSRKIPDSILDNFTCDSCHRFSSVLPVKVYSSGKKKCGRCSMESKSGVVSLFGNIAEQYLFPCVNRYDGCQELLAPSQVLDHEKHCESKNYKCPLCPVTVYIPTFLMIKHFEEMHEEALLETPVFHIDLKESLQARKWFLYRFGERLFFILFISEFEYERFVFHALCLRNDNGKVKIRKQISYHYGCNEEFTDVGLGYIIAHMNNEKSTPSKPDLDTNESLWISFQIEVISIELSEIYVLPTQERHPKLSQHPSSSQLKRHCNRNDASLIKPGSAFSEDHFLKRRLIFLDETLRDRRGICLGSTFDYLNIRMKNMYLHCFKCGQLSYKFNTYFVDTTESDGKVYLLCEICALWHQRTFFDYLNYDDGYIRHNDFLKVNFFCIWGCDQPVSMPSILEHEISCAKQPSRLCPLNSCAFKGKLWEIEKHFDEHSPKYNLTLNSVIEMELNPSVSPIKQFLIVLNAFVFLEIIWARPQWNMKILLCGKKNTFGGKKLKAMVIDSKVRPEILGDIEHDQIVPFYHREVIKIKCYLE
ncbi:hypothetical protein JTB14_027579 [Gonioctena quinquepunctata]|nr:hypothetical protein JTB14_027579 [Gonioctena quinquepunctata]